MFPCARPIGAICVAAVITLCSRTEWCVESRSPARRTFPPGSRTLWFSPTLNMASLTVIFVRVQGRRLQAALWESIFTHPKRTVRMVSVLVHALRGRKAASVTPKFSTQENEGHQRPFLCGHFSRAVPNCVSPLLLWPRAWPPDRVLEMLANIRPRHTCRKSSQRNSWFLSTVPQCPLSAALLGTPAGAAILSLG